MNRRMPVAILLAAWVCFAAAAEDPDTMGKCGSEKKEGDECALGICYSGKQTVYKCAKDKTCTRSDKKKDCDVESE